MFQRASALTMREYLNQSHNGPISKKYNPSKLAVAMLETLSESTRAESALASHWSVRGRSMAASGRTRHGLGLEGNCQQKSQTRRLVGTQAVERPDRCCVEADWPPGRFVEPPLSAFIVDPRSSFPAELNRTQSDVSRPCFVVIGWEKAPGSRGDPRAG